MVNLYQKLGISPYASSTQIQAALRRAAEKQILSLEQLQYCKDTLLNPARRVQYDAKLQAQQPELFQKTVEATPKVRSAHPSTLPHIQRIMVGLFAVVGILGVFLPWFSLKTSASFNVVSGIFLIGGKLALAMLIAVLICAFKGERTQALSPKIAWVIGVAGAAIAGLRWVNWIPPADWEIEDEIGLHLILLSSLGLLAAVLLPIVAAKLAYLSKPSALHHGKWHVQRIALGVAAMIAGLSICLPWLFGEQSGETHHVVSSGQRSIYLPFLLIMCVGICFGQREKKIENWASWVIGVLGVVIVARQLNLYWQIVKLAEKGLSVSVTWSFWTLGLAGLIILAAVLLPFINRDVNVIDSESSKGIINLYELLGIASDSTPADIQAALRHAAAEPRRLSAAQLQKCRDWLLNPDIRVKYDAKLRIEQPENFQIGGDGHHLHHHAHETGIYIQRVILLVCAAVGIWGICSPWFAKKGGIGMGTDLGQLEFILLVTAFVSALIGKWTHKMPTVAAWIAGLTGFGVVAIHLYFCFAASYLFTFIGMVIPVSLWAILSYGFYLVGMGGLGILITMLVFALKNK